eukprot:Blabericola_migrator_1__10596@NODE_601_length_7399_cov_48_594790_g438_i0_p5_GENE_NODE_601_length_7399_cov_48_594790_g438_i0NODE_601_length_7399_cov_48_594790_g438_i0_p5_ORF_typecomplete_len293_score33_01_NODE_601_length_7399_cov_48_594790_g438_i028703748
MCQVWRKIVNTFRCGELKEERIDQLDTHLGQGTDTTGFPETNLPSCNTAVHIASMKMKFSILLTLVLMTCSAQEESPLCRRIFYSKDAIADALYKDSARRLRGRKLLLGPMVELIWSLPVASEADIDMLNNIVETTNARDSPWKASAGHHMPTLNLGYLTICRQREDPSGESFREGGGNELHYELEPPETSDAGQGAAGEESDGQEADGQGENSQGDAVTTGALRRWRKKEPEKWTDEDNEYFAWLAETFKGIVGWSDFDESSPALTSSGYYIPPELIADVMESGVGSAPPQ